MPEPLARSCWGKLDRISQLVGQINGMAYGCRRWNVPAFQVLDVELNELMNSTFCHPAAVGVGSPAYNSLIDMMINVELVLDSFGMNPGGWEELAKEEVGRVAASATVGEIESLWLTGLDDIYKWYAERFDTHFNGHSPTLPIPEAVR